MILSDEDIASSIYMGLRSFPSSEQSRNLADAVTEALKTHRPTRKVRQMIALVIADLIRTARACRTRYCYRSLAASAFSKGPIGYHPFRRTVRMMETEGLLEIIRGTGGGTGPSVATRFRATPDLLELAAVHGVIPADWESHFDVLPRPTEVLQPVVVRAASVTKLGEKTKGIPIRIDRSRSPARQLSEQVQRLNAFFADASIEPAESHYAFNRVFNDGNIPGFAWNKGGRLYSMGDSYQQMPRIERAKMKLNGEEVVELDLRASHLTILHALLKYPFDPTADPYQVAGLPRHIVKAWVTMTLGYDRFQRRWSEENKRKYQTKTGGDLQKAHPIAHVRSLVTTHLPALANWPECKVRWGDLQFIESQVVIGAVETLALDHGVPALPVHDSIIVPKSAKALAHDVFAAQFEKITGVRPAIT